MAISGILLAIAVPRFGQLRGPYTLRQTSSQIAAEFTRARMRAIARNARYRLTYNAQTRTYALDREVGSGSWSTEYRNQLASGVSIEFPGSTPIFDTRGMLNQTATIPIHIQGSSSTRTVTINVLGNVTIS